MSTGFIKPPGGRFYRIDMAPNASHVYDLDWADPDDTWLLPGDSITSVVYEVVTAGGLVHSDDAHTASKTQTRLDASAAEAKVYLVTAHITTLLNNPDSRSFEVCVAVR